MGVLKLNSHYVTGIAGALGAGKSFVAKKLCEQTKGALIQVDDIRRDFLYRNESKFAKDFRQKLHHFLNLNPSNTQFFIDSTQLNSIVFKNEKNLQNFGQFCFPYFNQEIDRQIKSCNCYQIYLEWAYLIEQGYLNSVDSVILVNCSKITIDKRLTYDFHFTSRVSDMRRQLEPSFESRLKTLSQQEKPFKIYDNN